MIINSILPRFNNIQQARSVEQPRLFKTNMPQPAKDVFIKQPSFRGVEKGGMYFTKLYTSALQRNDIPLLKKMIEDNNWQEFHDCKVKMNFRNVMNIILTDGLFSTNQKIKDLFNDKNLYNLAKQYINITDMATEYGPPFQLLKIYFSMTEDPKQRKIIAEDSCYKIYKSKLEDYQKTNKLSQFPMSDLERYFMRTPESEQQEYVKEIMNVRLQRILSKNGDKTPEELLNCLNDLIISPEILEMQYDNSKLIDKIASIPANDENKEIISKIAKKLSEMKLPNNETFRNAGIIAAKNGNAELLKVLDSQHVYYRTNLQEEISSFPANVQEIISNAKINDEELISFANVPSALKIYLISHPNSGINSIDKEGNSLAIEAVKAKNFETLELLAEHDDFDWNMLDKNNNNLLTQLIDTYNNLSGLLMYEYHHSEVNKLLQFLRKLPQDKFDINHTNYSYLKYFNNSSIQTPSYFCFYSECGHNMDDDIIAFPDFNPNLKLIGRRNSIMEWCSNIFYDFKKLLHHPNTDISYLLDPITIDSLIYRNNCESSLNYLHEFGTSLQFAKEAKTRYNENGMLDLKEIESFVNHPHFNQIMNTKFNIAEENIAHLLVDIHPDITNTSEVIDYIRIFETLSNKSFDFNQKDLLGKTPLDKARLCENKIAINILEKYQ